MTLNLIAAVARDGGLGRDGALLFHIREDLRRFQALTLGKTVLMGRGTLLSLPDGRPLAGRRNLVLTHDASLCARGVECFSSVEALLAALSPEETGWVIGGAAVYRLLLPRCSRAYLTEVDAVRPADRFFPKLDEAWSLEHAGPWQHADALRYRFCVYRRQPDAFDCGAMD